MQTDVNVDRETYSPLPICEMIRDLDNVLTGTQDYIWGLTFFCSEHLHHFVARTRITLN